MPFAYQALRPKASVPDAPTGVTIGTVSNTSIAISWTAPAFTGGAPLTDYKVEWSSNAGGAWNTFSHTASTTPSITVTSLTNYLTYIFRVSAINPVGTGVASSNSASILLANAASGGTYSTYTYAANTWARHIFDTSSTLQVTRNPHNFRVTLIGGGGGSGYDDCPTAASTSGGGGGGYILSAQALSITTYTMTVGAADSDSTMVGIGTAGGGGHGCREMYGQGWSAGRAGTWGGTSNGGNGESCGTGGYGTTYSPNVAFQTLQNGTSISPAGNRGGMTTLCCCSNAGQTGRLVVEYIIA